MFKQDLEIKKQPFCFSYTVPTYDWYDTKNVVIKWREHISYIIEWRYGGQCWIVANDYDKKNNKWIKTQIGRLESTRDVYEFIKWCECLNNCSVLVGIQVIDGCINLYEQMQEVMKIGVMAEQWG